MRSSFDTGKFVISLDFELYWGVKDKRTIENYGPNLLGVKKVIPALLHLFQQYGISATFSTVGFLFAKNKQELISYLPEVKPEYNDTNLSPYSTMSKVGESEEDDPYHFGYSLLEQIKTAENHEISSHTFCHYYCLEPGQTKESFRQDLQAAKKIAADKDINVRSLVFPRNQFNEEYLAICKETGIETFRGNPDSWLYAGRNKESESIYRRAIRFVDFYINLSGHHCHTKDYILSYPLVNVAASRFLRPYKKKLAFLDFMRLRRIKKSMLHAAKKNKVFHLWWHPHNFGVNIEENLLFLQKILDHYLILKTKYNMESLSMSGIHDLIITEKIDK
jgi:peptidoglycan/xylan/chitin deacetylase (PgdA/CDA1 family)